MKLEPTFSGEQVAQMCGRSEPWVRAQAQAHGLGRMEGRQKRYTRADARRLQKLADPDETRGRPRSGGVSPS